MHIINPVTHVTNPILAAKNPVTKATNPVTQTTNPVSQVTSPVSQVTSPVTHVKNSVTYDPNPVTHIPNSDTDEQETQKITLKQSPSPFTSSSENSQSSLNNFNSDISIDQQFQCIEMLQENKEDGVIFKKGSGILPDGKSSIELGVVNLNKDSSDLDLSQAFSYEKIQFKSPRMSKQRGSFTDVNKSTRPRIKPVSLKRIRLVDKPACRRKLKRFSRLPYNDLSEIVKNTEDVKNFGEVNSGEEYTEVKCGEIKHGEIKHGEIKYGEIKHGQVKHGEVKYGEIKSRELKKIRDMNSGEYKHFGERKDINSREMNLREMKNSKDSDKSYFRREVQMSLRRNKAKGKNVLENFTSDDKILLSPSIVEKKLCVLYPDIRIQPMEKNQKCDEPIILETYATCVTKVEDVIRVKEALTTKETVVELFKYKRGGENCESGEGCDSGEIVVLPKGDFKDEVMKQTEFDVSGYCANVLQSFSYDLGN